MLFFDRLTVPFNIILLNILFKLLGLATIRHSECASREALCSIEDVLCSRCAVAYIVKELNILMQCPA